MHQSLKGLWIIVSLAVCTLARAGSGWSTQDYTLYPGDFNGDGLTDMLYIAKDASHPNGIVLSDGTGLTTTLQTWGNAYLGIPWSSGQYTIIVADFDGDGKADLLLQRKTPGDHYLLLTEVGGVGAISQTIAQTTAGLAWSADQHTLVAGDFNGDGKADLFFQAPDAKGLNAVILADGNGQFSAAAPDQSWNEGYAGLNWAASEAHVYSADFNGDGRSDLLVQALPIAGTGPGTSQPAQFVPNRNGVVTAQAGKTLFTADTLQAWSRNGFGADWSPLSSQVVTGDFNGDGKADVLLQGQTALDASYLLYGRAPGAIFAAATSLGASGTRSADTTQLLVGQFLQGKGQSLYAQARVAGQSNRLMRVGGTGFAVALADASLPLAASGGTPPTGLRSAAAAGGLIAPAVLTATSAGRTAGQFAVSAMGAATYQIPIWTPPGARGIEPHLALTYASGSPDGMMGPGWNLSGLSSIARCNKTYAENGGVPAPVTLTTSDDFCMDGNRLRVTGTGVYGANGTTYQTEIANFSNVTSYLTAGNGPSYFIVQGKDGLYYEYGNTVDSKAYANAGTTPYAWMLNKVRDRQGNNLVVVYSTTSGSVQPASIQYTQTLSTSGTYPYTMSFTYQARVTNLSRYVAGGNIQQTQVLAKVDVQSSGASVRHYNVTYATAPTTARDRVAAIQECGGSTGTDCLRATTVTYQAGAAGVAAPTTLSGSGSTNGKLYSFDIDGDGRKDMIYATNSGINNHWWVQFATTTGYAAPVDTGMTTAPTDPVLFDDFLGTSKISIFAPQTGVWKMSQWNAATSAFVITSTGIPLDTNRQPTLNLDYCTADINGDGLPDLISVLNDTRVYVRLNTSSGGVVSFQSTATVAYSGGITGTLRIGGNNQFPSSSVQHMDINGDGREDIIWSGNINTNCHFVNGTFVCTQVAEFIVLVSNGSSFQAGYTAVGAGGNPNTFLPLTFNDDACTDFAVPGTTTIYIAGCNGGTAITIGAPANLVAALDWDGDGRTDLLANVAGSLSVYRSLATATSVGLSTGIPNVATTFAVTDQNGDGLADLAFADSTAGYAIKYGLHNGASTPADLATTISDGWGIAASPTYVPITQNNYTKHTDAVLPYAFPESKITAPMYVVGSASQSDGLGGMFTNTFWYYDAVVNRQGRGFEGFWATRSEDSRNTIPQYTYYNQAYPYTGTVFERDTYQPGGSVLISSTINHFSVTDLSGAGCSITTTSVASRCFPYLLDATSKSFELTSGTTPIQTSVSSFGYDSYGNPLTATTTTTDNDSNSSNFNGAWKSVITNTYGSLNTSTWCLDKPTRTTTANTVPGQTVQTRTVDHAVDVTNCRYTSETVEPASSLTAVTNFGYDTCGNVNSVGVVGLDQNGATMPARTTTSSYGVRCTFPESVTNALSQIAYTAYNYSYGVKASSTDPNGVSVSWLYDNFGRKTRENRPDATFSTMAYTDCTADPCWGVANLRFLAQTYQYDSTSTLIRHVNDFTDGLGRGRYHEYDRVLGVFEIEETTYDALGRKRLAGMPYSSGSNGYHLISYDLLNRPRVDDLYNSAGTIDRSTGMAYAGLKSTITDARGISTTKWTDVAGKLRRIIDPAPGGTTNYTYDAFGNLNQITDAKLPTGAVTSYVYNIRGFKTDSTDPDTGHWVYTPNSLNELMKQVDAKSQQTTFAYDLLGRMTARVEPESTTATTWTYGTSAAAHNIGRLASLSKPDGYQESYSFDALGRPAGTTITEDTAYNIGYAYNSLGAVDTVTYPASTGSPFVLKYLYSYGALQQVKDNAAGTVFWALSAANDASLPMTEVLGNGVNVSSTYKPWTNELLTRQEGTGGVGNSLQDLAYQWDLNGNMLQRKDQKQLPNQTEIFVHDALNRISSSTLNGVTNLTVGYDAAGNITSKSDVGTYDYTTVQSGCSYQSYLQPHAVRKAGTAVYCYDANGNAISRQGGALTWTSYNLPSAIAFGSNSTTFNYNASHQRWKQDANYAGVHEITYYIGGLMEKVTKGTGPTEYRHRIPAGSGSAILTRRSDLTTSTYYTTSDHLGSGDLVLSSTATVLAKESFTPFGARRGSNWAGIPTTADYSVFSNVSRRGFTGHEMLDSVGLVHMNGRVYDPTIGRFLSADPIIQTLAISQAINPFSYVMNMPLTLTDPSGLSWLSKLFSGIGSFLKKFWKPILAIIVVMIAMPYIAAYFANSVAMSAAQSAFALTGDLTIALDAGVTAAAVAAPWISVVSGAIAGAMAGAITGGSKGVLVGALTGGILAESSWLWSNVENVGARGLGETLTNGVIGGGASSALGGRFQDGFLIAAAATGALKMYEYVTTKYEPTWRRGGDVAAKPAGSEPARPDYNNIGVARASLGDIPWYYRIVPRYEGNWLFRGLNQIPGFNSFATLHDWFMGSINNSVLSTVANIPSMAPMLGLNYAALLSGTPSMIIAEDHAQH